MVSPTLVTFFGFIVAGAGWTIGASITSYIINAIDRRGRP